MKLRDRIRGFCRLAPERIRPNPKNWRTHPEAQRDALKGVLADVGIADAVLVVPCDVGALAGLLTAKDFDAWLRGYRGDFMLVDGHLRTETITGQPVPALVLDLDEREQAEVLATFDPVGDLAGMDRERFIALAGEFNSTNAAVQSLVADLASMEARMRGAADDGEPVDPAADQKSLDDLEDEFGTDTDETLFWPEIRVKVPSDVLDRWTATLGALEGKLHERIVAMLDAIDEAAGA